MSEAERLERQSYYGSLSGPCFVHRHDDCGPWRSERLVPRPCGCECHTSGCACTYWGRRD